MPRPRQTTLTTNSTALNTLPVPIPNVWSKSGSPIDESRREDAFIKSLKATEINARLRGRFVDATALKNIATLSRFIPYSSVKQKEEETRERERLKRLLVVSIARSESMNQVDVAMRFLRGMNAEPLTRVQYRPFVVFLLGILEDNEKRMIDVQTLTTLFRRTTQEVQRCTGNALAPDDQEDVYDYINTLKTTNKLRSTIPLKSMNYNPLQKVFRDVDKIKIGPMITPTSTTTTMTTIATTTTTTTTTPTIYTVVDTMDSDDGMNEYKDEEDDDDEDEDDEGNPLSTPTFSPFSATVDTPPLSPWV